AELTRQLTEARREAAHPLSEAWGEARTLLGALEAAADPEDARLRLRSALRRVVDGIWLLVVRRGRDALCGAQVWFKKDGRRDYLIFHRPPKGNNRVRREGFWQASSLPEAAGKLDLRQPEHVKQLEAFLLKVQLPAG